MRRVLLASSVLVGPISITVPVFSQSAVMVVAAVVLLRSSRTMVAAAAALALAHTERRFGFGGYLCPETGLGPLDSALKGCVKERLSKKRKVG